MTCVKCGQSAVGKELAGQPHCHRIECKDWKAERLKRGVK